MISKQGKGDNQAIDTTQMIVQRGVKPLFGIQIKPRLSRHEFYRNRYLETELRERLAVKSLDLLCSADGVEVVCLSTVVTPSHVCFIESVRG